MKNGLFSKMIAAYTIIISLSFVITSAILSLWFQNYYMDQRRSQISTEAEIVKGVALAYLDGSASQQRANATLENVAEYLSSDIKADMFIMDMYGYIYAVSDTKYNNLIGKQIPNSDLNELRKSDNKLIERANAYNKVFGKAVDTYEIPIFFNGDFSGAIMINTSVTDIKHPLKRVYIIIWISAIFAIITACFVLYYFSQKIIIKPLEEINSVARKIAKGEVEKRVNIKSDDEIGELVESFNFMADSVEKVEKNRREFISNVSHEIRSPITSIKGFIGGILDGIIPRDRERYYLSLTYDEINRLTRLVNDLLDLSAIEAGHLKLNIVKLNIIDMIKNTVIKFETKINEKKLRVDVCFDYDELYVLGDEDRINQVITNLIDNAVKYVNEEGTIRITTKVKFNKVYISIYNNGPQINDQDFKHIWDRFYKSDKSRTKKMSTGLGLPIVRSILTQHGEDIFVENKKEGGVEFTFSLKVVK